MSDNLNPTAEEIFAELNSTPDGKVQLELAALRVLVAKQQLTLAEQEVEDE